MATILNTSQNRMQVNYKAIFLFLIILFVMQSQRCENKFVERRYRFVIKNDSGVRIKLWFSGVGPGTVHYPDTSLPAGEPIFVDVPAGQSRYPEFGIKFEEFFEKLPSDTLCVFIFDGDSVEKYPWNVIRSKYKVLKRFDISLPDFENLKFKISFPPTNEMKGIKMFPR